MVSGEIECVMFDVVDLFELFDFDVGVELLLVMFVCLCEYEC